MGQGRGHCGTNGINRGYRSGCLSAVIAIVAGRQGAAGGTAGRTRAQQNKKRYKAGALGGWRILFTARIME